MKRSPKISDKKLKGIKIYISILFWHKCCKCGYEYKKEKMYKKYCSSQFNEEGNFKYLCTDCAKSKKDAMFIFNEEE